MTPPHLPSTFALYTPFRSRCVLAYRLPSVAPCIGTRVAPTTIEGSLKSKAGDAVAVRMTRARVGRSVQALLGPLLDETALTSSSAAASQLILGQQHGSLWQATLGDGHAAGCVHTALHAHVRAGFVSHDAGRQAAEGPVMQQQEGQQRNCGLCRVRRVPGKHGPGSREVSQFSMRCSV